MSMGVDKLVSLLFHGRLYIGVIIMTSTVSVQVNWRSVHPKNEKGDNDLGQLFFKRRISFDGLVSRKKVLSYYSHLN